MPDFQENSFSFSYLLLYFSVQWLLAQALSFGKSSPLQCLPGPPLSSVYHNHYPFSMCTRLAKFRVFTHSYSLKTIPLFLQIRVALTLSQVVEFCNPVSTDHALFVRHFIGPIRGGKIYSALFST